MLLLLVPLCSQILVLHRTHILKPQHNTKNAKFRHYMMTSSNGNIFRVTGLCAGNSPVPVNSPHKIQWRGALMFSLICVWINRWVYNREAGDSRRHRGHYDVYVMIRGCPVDVQFMVSLAVCRSCRTLDGVGYLNIGQITAQSYDVRK